MNPSKTARPKTNSNNPNWKPKPRTERPFVAARVWGVLQDDNPDQDFSIEFLDWKYIIKVDGITLTETVDPALQDLMEPKPKLWKSTDEAFQWLRSKNFKVEV